MIFWISQASGYGAAWSDLERCGFLTREEMQHAERCEDYLRHLRIRLHLHLGRREDRLLFDYQNALAAQFGFEATEARRASEQLMQEYYRNAKAITGLNTILLQNIGAALYPHRDMPPEILDDHFQAVGDLLTYAANRFSSKSPPPSSTPSCSCRNSPTSRA